MSEKDNNFFIFRTIVEGIPMKSRRGSLWGAGMNEMIMQFKAGDIVKPIAIHDHSFIGVVREVDPRINKVMVAWGNGRPTQHDPEEIMLSIHQDPIVRARMASGRRVKKADASFFEDRIAGEKGLVTRRGRMAKSLTATKWGFDLTNMRASVFAKVLRSVGISTTPKDTDKGWIWSGPGIIVVTANNPFTGEAYMTRREGGGYGGEKDYLSYVGIEGQEDKVKIVADGIRSMADYKDESPNARDFI